MAVPEYPDSFANTLAKPKPSQQFPTTHSTPGWVIENSLAADIYDLAYKIKAKGETAVSQNVFYLIV